MIKLKNSISKSNKYNGKIVGLLNNEAALLMSRRDYGKALNIFETSIKVLSTFKL